jgi:hypothetical protein
MHFPQTPIILSMHGGKQSESFLHNSYGLQGAQSPPQSTSDSEPSIFPLKHEAGEHALALLLSAVHT